MTVVPPIEPTPSAVRRESNPNQLSAEDRAEQSPRSSENPSDSDFSKSLGDARLWLAAVADSSDDAIVGKDLNGIVKSWNKAAEQMFGFTADEIIGRPITCIIPAARIEEEVLILTRIRRNEKILHFETERQRKDGLLFPVSLTISPIRDEQNRVIGVSKIARDLTERDRREEKLRATNAELERLARHLAKARNAAEQANRAKSHFLAGMSHELRTPLNGIVGYAELLHRGENLDATQIMQVEAMQTAAKHLVEMINCVLDLSEIETGRVGFQPVECEIRPIAAACLDLVRPMAEAKGLALSLAVSPGARRQVVTDPMRLRQVLFNLLGNAAKFTSEGAIEVRLRNVADGSALRIEVTDTGPGILTDQRQRLFQDFGRLDTAGTIEGAGLGLALSSRLADLMGGRLGHDDNPGGGSVFWLELPSGNTAASARAALDPAGVTPAQPVQTGTLDVLVVDDVIMNRDIAASFLRTAGHNVTCAEGGAEAVAAVASMDFNVVLMDVRMPGMDGLEATRRIRALNDARAQVPIVALTAQALTEQVAKCLEAGMDGHLAKPYRPDDLLSAVGDAVRRGRGDRESRSPSPTPAAVAKPVGGADLPVLDPSAFDRTAAFLSPEVIADYLQTIANNAETLLCTLRKTDALSGTGDQLAEAVHTLASSAGLLGFERLAASGRHFEQAIHSRAAETPASASAFSAAIEATLRAIHDRSTPAVGT